MNLDLRRLIGRLSSYCRHALESAAGLAVSRGHYEVSIEHMLLALAEDSRNDLQVMLAYFDVEPAGFRRQLQAAMDMGRTGNQGRPVFSPLLIEWIREAWLVASVELGLDHVRSGALLATIVARPSRFADLRWQAAIAPLSYEVLRKAFDAIVSESRETALQAPDPAARNGQINSDSALARFCTNFTEQARAGRIDAVFCRDREIQQMVDILGRRRKNNPICVGEAGVGKTAVVEGLALKIAQGDVPDFLKEVELVGLDLGMLQAGAGVKGEFEARLKSIMDEVRSSPRPIVLFIDEAHMLIGAGGQAGAGDAANLLKPALARGELKTIAATTWSEYKKYFEKDPALARRFQLVKLDEPSPDQAVTILRGLRNAYEQAHGVYIRDEAVEAAARLSARYISGRQLPDKAVDVLDTACARVKLSQSAKPPAIELGEKQLAGLNRTLDALKRDHRASSAEPDPRLAAIADEIATLEAELEQLGDRLAEERRLVRRIVDIRSALDIQPGADGQAQASPYPAESGEEALRAELYGVADALRRLQCGDPLVSFEVTGETVARVVSDWTGVPLGNVVRDDARALLTLAEQLGARVLGQDQAIGAVVERMRTAKAGLQNPDAPMGVFLFVGPSGVGKTELAGAIADQLFGGERFLVSINMSEFQERHTVSKLIGSPPGYVGYGEGGLLTEAVRQRPYCVVLLDEVEKADPEVMNLFYQVFDKGLLSDGEGRIVDFRNTIVVLTSNLAADLVTDLGTRGERPSAEDMAEAIRPVLSAYFKPALLARMQIVPFYPLAGAEMERIIRLKLGQVAARLRENQRMELDYADAVVAAIAARCTDVESGARNIDRIVNRTILPQLATELLGMMGADGHAQSAVSIGLEDDGRFSFAFS